MSSIETKLRTIIQEHSKVSIEKVGMDEDLINYLDLDSLSGLKLLAVIEKKFSIKFPDERLHDFRTLKKIIAEIKANKNI